MENAAKNVHLDDLNPYTPPNASLEMHANGVSTSHGEKLNPWFSMWVKPRATIQQIINDNPQRFVLILTAIASFSDTLDRASWQSLGDKMELPMIFALAAVAGPFLGIVKLYMGGALLRWTGGWLGGAASAQHIRAAMAWSSVPAIWGMILWIPLFALFGSELFTTETPILDENEYMMYALIALGVFGVVIEVWAFVAFLKCLGQVQSFSAWKSLGNILLALLIMVLPVAALFALLNVVLTVAALAS